MIPSRSSRCECCKQKSPKVVFDTALTQHTSFGIRGSWHLLCIGCHKVLGSGFEHDKTTMYVLINGKYIEQKGIHLMTSEEIQQTIDMFTQQTKDPIVKAKIVFHGEIALQLAILNKNIEETNALERRKQMVLLSDRAGDEQQVTGG